MPALLEPTEIPAALRAVPAWHHAGAEISRTYTRRDFADAMAFVNRVAALAEADDHHPDIDIRWNQVTLRLSTHSKGGLTPADFALAAKIDAAACLIK